LIRPRFVCGGAAGVATGLQRHCLIARQEWQYRSGDAIRVRRGDIPR